MRTPGADSIDLTRKVYMMSTKTHVVAPIMMAVTVAAATGIALAPPASALRGNCGANTFTSGSPNPAASLAKAKGGSGCDDPFAVFLNDLRQLFSHDRKPAQMNQAR